MVSSIPQYTRPAEFRGWKVPEVLLSGNHARIESWRREQSRVEARNVRNPIDRLFGRLPKSLRVFLDWALTIVGAIAIVLAIKAWVVNPYRIPTSSMEPTLHCARPGPGCEASFSDRVLADRFSFHFRNPHRGEIIVFKTPPNAHVRPAPAAGSSRLRQAPDRPPRRDGRPRSAASSPSTARS